MAYNYEGVNLKSNAKIKTNKKIESFATFRPTIEYLLDWNQTKQTRDFNDYAEHFVNNERFYES